MIAAPPRPAAFAALAATRPAPAGAAFLRSGVHARRLLLLKALLVRVRRHRDEVAPETRRAFETAWSLLERTERGAPAVVRAVLDYPTTGAWLAAALTEPAGPALDRHLSRLELIAATAALRAGRPLDLVVGAPAGVLSLPGVGSVLVDPGPVRLTSRSQVVRIHSEGTPGAPAALLRLADPRTGAVTGGGPGWCGLRRLSGGAARLEDLDPYRVPPGGVGTPARVAAERPDIDHAAWSAHWRAARELLRRTDRERAAEVGQTVGALVPLLPQGPRSVGATLSVAPGAVLMTPSAGATDMAETLVHELHHSKLSTLHELVPLYRPGSTPVLYRVGWRTDARPVAGVFQGAYAHLALADLWRKARDAPGAPGAWSARAAQQFDHVHDQVGEALSMLLESDELTNEGREFARQMRQLHASLGASPGARG
ncbi:HEXXH motif domain-containing protein [Streptomyces sp. NBC_00572]|uniref:HEXXH motif domain-containing protein n=1 Tax=Streptomyces sp. NBC_00572 TaxID=2903664 RepID=UPI00225AF78F|nr:HEXXH motif domain-containing protein [Streptomyces sp. NBC_00572]MCX4983424.1 HEXXH motif domain-containing protein [Streptomyces sp. NBC_00572]